MKKLSTLLSGITLNYNDHYFCINFLPSFKAESKLKSQENVCKNHDNCNVKMHRAYNKILELNQEQRYIKISFIIYAETESLLERYTHVITLTSFQQNCSLHKQKSIRRQARN